MNKDRLHYVGETPAVEYWPYGEIPEEFQAKYYIFDGEKVSTHYQKLDCVSLCIIFNMLSRSIYEITKLDLGNFMTISSLAYKYVMSTVPTGMVKVCSERAMYSWIRKSVRGGNVFSHKRFFSSDYASSIRDSYRAGDNETLEKLNEQCDDYLDDMDGVSLYPSRMDQ